ncbi:MAG: hypothetical protein ACI4CC_00205 [Lachnospiraceae bacterium]
MLYDYILGNFEKGEPIFLAELPGTSRDYVRQEMKKLTDEGKIERLYNGVYYLPYLTVLGTKGRISVEKYIEKRYICPNGEIEGYVTGIQLANDLGLTTQNPSCYEICSNEATTKQRKAQIDGRNIIIYKPLTRITEENASALQFLDLMTTVDKYSELTGERLKKKLNVIVDYLALDFDIVKKYLELYPDKVYKNIYQGGLMGELV